MQTYEVIVRDRSIRANSPDMTTVRTSVGIDRLHILFSDDEWLEFPVTATFGHDDVLVSETLVVTRIEGSGEFVAESYADIPREVTSSVGQIRVTLQGTDSQGRHIITAKGAPLSVEEAGDVVEGDAPSGAPTVDQWQQAYADAMVAVGQAASLVASLQERLDEIVSEAETSIDSRVSSVAVPATRESLGSVKVGDGLGIAQDGELYATVEGLSQAQSAQLANLASLAYYCFDTEFDAQGNLIDTAAVKPSALPKATMLDAGAVIPDGRTVTVNQHGMLTSVREAPTITVSVDGTSGSPSAVATVDESTSPWSLDIAFSGLVGAQGVQGEVGPSGYVLTQDDIDAISANILAQYQLGDNVGY